MFALVRGILLRPLPVRAQDRLILSWKDLPSAGYAHHPFGDREIDAVARDSRLLEAVAGLDANGAGRGLLVEDGNASYVRSAFVTGRFFECSASRRCSAAPCALKTMSTARRP